MFRRPTRSAAAVVSHPKAGGAAVAQPGVEGAEVLLSHPLAAATKRRSSPAMNVPTVATPGIGCVSAARRSVTNRHRAWDESLHTSSPLNSS